MKTIHYIHHTHWDREWYRSEGAFRVRLVSTIDLLLKTLEDDKKLKYFVLDGQCAILEDYLQIKPHNFNRIKNLVKENKLIIGPWYIQPDMFLVSSESLIRNLQIGINYCQQNFDNVMKMGWIPDAFGQISQTPQIFSSFGFSGIYSWRGFANTDTNYNYFMWEAPNKKRLINIHFYLGYGFFRYLNSDINKAKEELLTNVEKFVDRTFSDNILFTGGSDHASVQTNLSTILENVNPKLNKHGYEVKQSTPQILLAEIQKFINNNNFDVEIFKGEAKSPKMGRIHAGIASTRQDLKHLNKVYEDLLVNVVEPLNVIMKTLKMPSNIELCIYTWKYLLQNQFHDSIYSSSPEQVNIDVENRYNELQHLTYELIFEALRFTRDRCAVKQNHFPIVIFNTLPFSRNAFAYIKIPRKFKDFKILDERNQEINYEIVQNYNFDFMSKDFLGILDLNSYVDAQNNNNNMYYDVVKIYVENIPANGHVVYSYTNEKLTFNLLKEILNVSNNIVSNKFIQVKFNDNGTIDVTNLKNNQTNYNLLQLINKGDNGDEYNYSWPTIDKIFNSTNAQTTITKLVETTQEVTMQIKHIWNLPQNIDKNQRSSKLVSNQILINVTLNCFDSTLDVDLKINNQSSDQIMLLRLPNVTSGKTHVAGDDFYFIKRENIISDAHLWKEQGLSEIPLSMYSFKNILHFNQENNQSLNVFTNSLSEYEISNNQHVDLTLFRSVSHLGKKDLETRPGRASGYLLETPSSQLLKEFNLNLKLNWSENNHNHIFNEYKNSYTELLSVAHRLTNKDSEEWFWENAYFNDIDNMLQNKNANIEIDNHQISYSALHEDLTTNNDNLRIFNANSKTVANIKVKLNDYSCKAANEIDLDHNIINKLTIINNEISIENIEPYTFTTIEFIKE